MNPREMIQELAEVCGRSARAALLVAQGSTHFPGEAPNPLLSTAAADLQEAACRALAYLRLHAPEEARSDSVNQAENGQRGAI